MFDLLRRGLERENNPHAYSVVGDCQSVPDVFMGLYNRPGVTLGKAKQLQDTADFFGGASGFAYHSGPVDGEKFIQFFDGTTAISLTAGISPAWSPDGSRLAFLSNRAGNWEVFVMNADGSGVTQLTDTQRHEDAPAWSPDGRFIVFSSERDGNAEIYRMAVDGTDVARLTNAPLTLDIQPVYSPDGARLAYVAIQNGAGRLFVMNGDGSNPQPLSEGEGESRSPAWSPDGQRLVFASDRANAGVFELYELTLATGAVRALTNSGTQNGSPHYSPDGRHILFDSNRDGNCDVYRLNLETLGVTALTRSERPLFNGDPSWRP
jgi:WD40 repeat protein